MSSRARTKRGKPRAVVLFGGVGGGTLGLLRAGYDVVLVVERDPHVCEAHEKLTGIRPECADVISCDLSAMLRTRKIDPETIDLFLMSPPCEAISNAGERNPGDKRNFLLMLSPARVARELHGAWIVVENVATLVSARRNVPLLEAMLNNLQRTGRHVPTVEEIKSRYVMQAADYGIPQSRKRVFVPIPPAGQSTLPTYPAPTHADPKKESPLPKWITLGAALESMGSDPCPFSPKLSPNETANYGAPKSKHSINYRKRVIKRARQRGASEAYDPFAIPKRDEPAPCLTSNMRRGACRVTGMHPTEPRHLTIGEIMVALFQMGKSARPMDCSGETQTRRIWDMLADAIVPRCAELVARAIRATQRKP